MAALDKYYYGQPSGAVESISRVFDGQIVLAYSAIGGSEVAVCFAMNRGNQ